MKFVLFCEGWTETSALPEFLRRWLDSQSLAAKVGIKPVRFNGWAEMVKDCPTKARLHLQSADVIAVIALLDLYGPSFFPNKCESAADRFEWAKKDIEKKVNDPRFRQHFAVHDVEAWILSQPDVLPLAVQKKLPGKVNEPETVNFKEPPASLLDRLYTETTQRGYKKRTYGDELFRKLDPNIVRSKCPYFRKLTDDMLELAQKALKLPAS